LARTIKKTAHNFVLKAGRIALEGASIQSATRRAPTNRKERKNRPRGFLHSMPAKEVNSDPKGKICRKGRSNNAINGEKKGGGCRERNCLQTFNKVAVSQKPAPFNLISKKKGGYRKKLGE